MGGLVPEWSAAHGKRRWFLLQSWRLYTTQAEVLLALLLFGQVGGYDVQKLHDEAHLLNQ
jgi:hypothetical protein